MLSLAVFMQTLLDTIDRQHPEGAAAQEKLETLRELNEATDEPSETDEQQQPLPPPPPAEEETGGLGIRNVNFAPTAGRTARSFVPIEREDGSFDFSHVTISPGFVPELLRLLRQGRRISEESVRRVLRLVYRRLRELPNTTEVGLDEKSKLTVVGDLHGQLADLFHILDESGLPNENNKFIFNGDFVDRGENSFEVVLLLFVLFLAHGPAVVALNRGNHEDAAVCAAYGFQREVEGRYGRPVFEMFAEVFRWLPLFSLVNGRLFVVHGGLFHRPGVTLADLAAIERADYTQKPAVPFPENCRGLAEDSAAVYREYLRQLQREALWSDPLDRPGVTASDRGAGVFFGPDVAREFMRRNGLAMVVRGHQCVFRGAENPFEAVEAGDSSLFGGPQEPRDFGLGAGQAEAEAAGERPPQLLTVFSASNYCGGANFGAFVQFATHPFGLRSQRADPSSDLHYLVKRFRLSPSNPSNPSSLVETNKTSLKELILKKKNALVSAFEAVDTTNCGSVSRLEWAEVMQRVTLIKILWLSILPTIVPTNCLSPNAVHYRLFIDAYAKTAAPAGRSLLRGQQAERPGEAVDLEHAVFDDIYGQRRKLEKMFYFFDTNGDGVSHKQP